MVEFVSKKLTTELLDPRFEFEKTTVEPELRFDPLTEETRRLGHFGMIKPQKPDLSVHDSKESKEKCPFCPGNIEKITPRYPSDILSQGYLKRGEARLMPNISPYDYFSALTVVSKEHLLTLENMTYEHLKDAFDLDLEFYKILAGKRPEAAVQFLGWNYMPPSGGGLIHPHQQVIASIEPGNFHRRLLEDSKRYKENRGVDFWDRLCGEEKEKKERFIHEGDNVTWLVSFAPLGVLGEYIAIFPGKKTVEDLDDETLNDFVEDLLKLFRFFVDEDIYSFNFGMYFAPLDEKSDGYTLQARIIPRVFLNLEERPPDSNVLQTLLHEPFSVVYPEELCKKVRPYFK